MRADLILIGFGHVGRRFARLLEERRNILLNAHDLDCRIVGIATRRHGAIFSPYGLDAVAAAEGIERGGVLGPLPGAAAVSSFDLIARAVAASAPLRVVIETTTLDIAAGQPAIGHVRAALAAGCHVVTANKGPAAFAYRQLQALADAGGLSFLFEGAVMDGVPIFNLVRETLPAVEIRAFRGVVNSTTNHILTALEDGEAFEPALERMQAEGIAEADATLDLEGWDAAAKAAALANVLMDADVTPHDVRRSGVSRDAGMRARSARQRGRRLRLVASGTRGDVPAVQLVELPADDLLAGLRSTANALVLTTDLLGDIAIAQLEGSLTQTAYALVSDLITVRRRSEGARGAPPRRTP